MATLALGSFAYVTSELLPVGLLSEISGGLGTSRSAVGLLLTIYAVVVVLAATPLTALSARMERRRLVVVLLVVMAASNLVAAAAPGYAVLAGARVACGLAHGVFWSIIASLAGRLLPGRQGLAVALVIGGGSVAVVAGVPLGTLLGQQAGWRTAFLAVGGLGLVAAASAAAMLPRLQPLSPAGQAPLTTLWQRPGLRSVVLITALVFAAHFTAFTYVTPFLRDVTGFSPSAISPVLLLFGVAGLCGTVIAGRTVDRAALPTLACGLTVQAAMLAVMGAAGTSGPVAVAAIFVWAAAVGLLPVALQTRVLQVAPDSPDAASALYVATFNVGIGGGALLGGVLLATAGARSVAWAGSAIALAALALLTASTRASR